MSIYFYGCMTLDGYLADSAHGLEWLDETGSVEETSYDSFYNSMDIIVMGKRTYDAIKNMDGVENFYNQTINYVFTNSNEQLKEGFIPIRANVIDFIENLDSEKNIWIVGGNTILAPLINQNLVDKYIIQIAPVLLGKGIPLFAQEEFVNRLTLENVERYGQFVELRYRR